MAKILVITPTPTHPRNAGNRARIFTMLSALRAAGHQVALIFVVMEDGDLAAMKREWVSFQVLPYRRPPVRRVKLWYDALMKIFGSGRVLPYMIDDWFDVSSISELDRLNAQIRPDAVIVEYAFMSRAFECFHKEVHKILDTHDILANRHLQLAAAGLPPTWFYTTPAEEKKALERADCILAIQPQEQAVLAAMTHRQVITVGHLVPSGGGYDPADRERHRLLFVGSANRLNVSALEWFIAEVWPRVLRDCPEACLDVVGECARHVPDADKLRKLGYVDDLRDCYRYATVVVNPLKAGTGLKIKAVEALAMGCPMVTTSVGCAGIERGAGKSFLVADTAEIFSASVVKILQSIELQEKLSQAALAFADEYNQSALQPLLDHLKKIEKSNDDE